MKPVQPGESIRPHMTAEWYNHTLPKTELDAKGSPVNVKNRLIICRTTTAITAADINTEDTSASVYYSGLVNTFTLSYSATGSYSPGALTRQAILINPSQEEIPSGTEVWALEAEGGILVATIWSC